MSKTTGPILAIGTLTWANQVVFSDSEGDVFGNTVKIAVATSVLAVGMSFIERASENMALALTYTALVTVLFVRINGKETPLERLMTTLNGRS